MVFIFLSSSAMQGLRAYTGVAPSPETTKRSRAPRRRLCTNTTSNPSSRQGQQRPKSLEQETEILSYGREKTVVFTFRCLLKNTKPGPKVILRVLRLWLLALFFVLLVIASQKYIYTELNYFSVAISKLQHGHWTMGIMKHNEG